MSDWAAKLSKKPATLFVSDSRSDFKTDSASEPRAKTETQSKPESGLQCKVSSKFDDHPITQKPMSSDSTAQNAPQVMTPNQNPGSGSGPKFQAKTQKTRTSRQGSPQRETPASPEPFNGTEILQWMSSRFNADFKEAQADKMSEHAAIYRSLESSSSWNTKGSSSGRKYAKEENRFDLLLEINRTFQQKPKRF